ncbi:MAG: molybdopterin dinucleotide binding domain-containing protein [Promethearchaeota archaeon]
MKMLLNSVRKVDNDQAKEHSLGNDSSLKDNLAIALLNTDDYNKLNLTSTSNIKITSEFGSVILKAKPEKHVPLGNLYVPISIWINQITGTIKNELVFKNIEVNVEPIDEPVLEFKDLLKIFKEA